MDLPSVVRGLTLVSPTSFVRVLVSRVTGITHYCCCEYCVSLCIPSLFLPRPNSAVHCGLFCVLSVAVTFLSVSLSFSVNPCSCHPKMSLPTPPNEQMTASEAVTIKVASTAVESSVSMSQSRVSGTSANVKLELNESDVLAVSGGIDGHGLDASGRDEGIVDRSPGERYVRFAEKLGCGAYKDVYRAYDTIEGIEVAWNEVKLSGISKSDKVRIINEVQLLQKLNHKNIISFYGSWTNREKEQVIFVTEILSSGTLKSFIKKVQVIRWNVAKRWANEILDGLVYLHTQDPPVSHRDLKCDNIFINGTSGDLRIGDLGLSTAISKSKVCVQVL